MKKIGNALAPYIKQINQANTIAGGMSMSKVQFLKSDEGVLVRVKTPSVKGQAYDVALKDHFLKVSVFLDKAPPFHEYGDDSEEITPALVHSIPLPATVDTDGIEAIFEDGELTIFVPYSSDRNIGIKKIDIRHN